MFKIEKIQAYFNNQSNDYSNEMIFNGFVSIDQYPNYELITANLSQDIADVSSETVAGIFRYPDRRLWEIKISCTGKSSQQEPWIWVEIILMKILN